MALCRANTWTACLGLIPEHDLSLFDRHGFQSTKIGEDALIDLRECEWRGKAFEWVRRRTNFRQRQGLVCREILGHSAAADHSRARMDELAVISE